MVPVKSVLFVQVTPAADAYCTDQPARLTALALLLYSSMKSLANEAPELPPPP
jgi:hypothetical protein